MMIRGTQMGWRRSIDKTRTKETQDDTVEKDDDKMKKRIPSNSIFYTCHILL